MSVRASEADQARLRATFLATNSTLRHGTFSNFIIKAALARAAELEAEYNDGEPWPAADPAPYRPAALCLSQWCDRK
jgi:hypothetical protein